MSLSTDEESFAPPRKRGMRTGFTTGACATAAATAATRALVTSSPVEQVTIHLPAGSDATFAIVSCDLGPSTCRCSVIKDAGDDPDVTHGAEICATVRWVEAPGVHLRGGEGVGVVTLRGLGLEVGGPAINPVPRRLLHEAVTAEAGARLAERGLEVEISVPRGAELAKKTLNARLGIVGGISILGTTGIVHPWSTAAWRASVEEAIDVAAANDQLHVVLTTGGRSEKYAMALLRLPEVAFVEMGIFTGRALQRCVQCGVQRVSLAGMIGKFSKLAQGHLQTHVAGNQVDPAFLAAVARECGAEEALVAEIRGANTARHVEELIEAAGLHTFFERLAHMVAERSAQHVGGRLQVEAIMYDFEGNVLGRADVGCGAPLPFPSAGEGQRGG
jgi:cobalt-precorrin-5B (C1)-methyltransferase